MDLLRRVGNFLALAATLFTLSASPAWSARHELFIEPGETVLKYDEIISSLKPGDELVFSDGKAFTVEKILGKGRTTLVLAITDGRALRIPLKAGYFRDTTLYIDWITEFLRASEYLRVAGVDAVQVFVSESLDGEYAVVERLNLQLTLEEFLEGKHSYDKATTRLMWEKLTEFGRTTWRFSKIGDFASRQIGWTGKRWVLFDFSNVFHSYRHNPVVTVFDELEISSLRAMAIVRAIHKERAKQDPEHCEQLLRKR